MPIKILDIVWYQILPARFGGQKGIEGFVAALSAHYEVVMLCSNNNMPAGTEPYKVLPLLPTSKWQFINGATRRLIRKVCVEEHITHVCIEHPYHANAAMYLRRTLQLPVIIHSHNLEAERFKSMGKPWWKGLWYYEKSAHQRADYNLFKTNADLRYAVEKYQVPAEKCMLLPYCLPAGHQPINKKNATIAVRLRYNIPEANKLLLFNGTLDYQPNAKAVERIYCRIVPLLAINSAVPFTIIICGRNELPAFSYLKKLQHTHVLPLGFVENIDELVAAADLFVNPVTEGGGIKTKVIDALAQHTSVVSFASGAEGINTAITGDKLHICRDDDDEKFVALVQQSWQKKNETPEQFFENYTWDIYIKQLKENFFKQ